ncbi:hypothetical protein [Actinobacillus pleuropneumoniae]|uniref:hypothetical protein n=1 Tax=Actinobacillus pleuropneumoniae TaxID=715 RepID=UPI003F7C9238
MYLNTSYNLLTPIYSLLTKPFDFFALKSLKILKNNMKYYYSDLEIVANIYDEEKDRLKAKLGNFCYKSESHYKCQLLLDNTLVESSKNLLDLHSIQVQMERLYDYFGLKREGGSVLDLNDLEYISVLNFLRINELLSLCIAGKIKVRVFNKKIIFSPADSFSKKEFYATWFSRYIEASSNLSTIKHILELSTLLKGKVNDDVLDFIFDKVFSIKFSEIPIAGRNLGCVRLLVLSIEIIFSIQYYLIANKTSYISIDELLDKFNLKKEDVVLLLELQKKQLVSEQFLFGKESELRINVTTFIKCIRTFFHKLSEEFKEVDKREYLLGGIFFEENSIKNRMSSLDYQHRYAVFNGINRGDIKIKNELDIEYIIYDKEEKRYYFIQSKYSIFGERSYFEGEVKQIQSDISKGLKQLRSARDLFEQGRLDLHLNKVGIENATLDNSSFILLHNIPQLDFQITKDKIALYDWNTFRNLLKNGECIIEDDGVYSLDKNIMLGNPQVVINKLLSEHKIYSLLKSRIDMNHKIVNRFTFYDKEIIVVGLGL